MIVRRATQADAADVWRWRQDPLTRAMSRSQGEVALEDHLRWFSAALADPRRTMLIGEADDQKVGLVRFDLEDVAEVSINVNPDLRGRGYGQALLLAAMSGVDGDVWAEIREENLASQRIFEQAGFVFQDVRDGLRRYVRPASGR